MTRPVRPGALVILTLCAIYPGLTLVFQGLYPFVAGEPFNLVGQFGPWMDLATRLHLPLPAVQLAKAFVGLLWLAAVPGLWAGDARAYPVALAAAALSLFYPWGPAVMGVVGLVCLLGFREDAEAVPA